MAHQAQKDFFNKVKGLYPEAFNNVKVIDFGSLDVNGKLNDNFTDSAYIGVDIVAGANVDVVSKAHKFKSQSKFDTVISGEMLEHDEYWKESLLNMYKLCGKGGLIAFSCAGKDRPEHGTRRTDGNEWGTGDYYKNLEPKDIMEVYTPDMFTDYYFEENTTAKDTYFYGIKK